MSLIKLGRWDDPSGTTIIASFVVPSEWERWIRVQVKGANLDDKIMAFGRPEEVSETIAIKSPRERDDFCEQMKRFLDGDDARADIEIGPHRRAACVMHRDEDGSLSISGMGKGSVARKRRVAIADEENLRILLEVLRVLE